MKKTLATMILGLSVSSMALAFGGGHHRGHFDWDELDLTDAQEERIDDIKDSFHDKFRTLRKSEGDRQDKKQEFITLRQQMMADINDVLTPEQQKEARELMLAKVEKRLNKRMKKLSHKLDLTDEQEATVKTQLDKKLAAVKTKIDAGEKPSYEDRKGMMADMDQTMQSILTAEQLEEWNEMKERRMQKMAKYEGGDRGWYKHH